MSNCSPLDLSLQVARIAGMSYQHPERTFILILNINMIFVHIFLSDNLVELPKLMDDIFWIMYLNSNSVIHRGFSMVPTDPLYGSVIISMSWVVIFMTIIESSHLLSPLHFLRFYMFTTYSKVAPFSNGLLLNSI
jgi:hypothetical protein